jgi:hypothetical protein
VTKIQRFIKGQFSSALDAIKIILYIERLKMTSNNIHSKNGQIFTYIDNLFPDASTWLIEANDLDIDIDSMTFMGRSYGTRPERDYVYDIKGKFCGKPFHYFATLYSEDAKIAQLSINSGPIVLVREGMNNLLKAAIELTPRYEQAKHHILKQTEKKEPVYYNKGCNGHSCI